MSLVVDLNFMDTSAALQSRLTSVRLACIIPTYNAGGALKRLFDSLSDQTVYCDVYVVDSSSTDGTLEIAKKFANDVVSIPKREFNHGGTRQMMIEINPCYDIYVFLTQDAYLANRSAIESVLKFFEDGSVGAVCGRQLPHQDANPLARHARAFNYPSSTQIRSFADAPRLGLKTAFISNSFAAYRASALGEVGGFPRHVIFGEDMYVAARMLLAGWKVAYAGDAQCCHSHNYTLAEEFRRYFDIGVFHARESWIRKNFGGVGGEGLCYVKSELKCLGLNQPHLWPKSLLSNVLKLVAYKLGQHEKYLPISLKRTIGMSRLFWYGPFAKLVSGATRR